MEITTLSQAKDALVTLSESEKQKLAQVKAFEAANRLLLGKLRHENALKGNAIAAEHIGFLRKMCFNGMATIDGWTLSVEEPTRLILAYSLRLFDEWRQHGMPDNHVFIQLHDIMLKELPCITAFDTICQMPWYKERIPAFFTNPARMSLSPPLHY